MKNNRIFVWSDLILRVFLKFICLVLKAEHQNGRERQRKALHLLIYSANGPNSHDWFWLQTEARNSIYSSHKSAGAQVHRPFSIAFPSALARSCTGSNFPRTGSSPNRTYWHIRQQEVSLPHHNAGSDNGLCDEAQRDRDRKTQEEISHPLFHSSNACSIQG